MVNYIIATMVFYITARMVNCNTSPVLITTAICSGKLRELGAKAEKLASCGGAAGGLGPREAHWKVAIAGSWRKSPRGSKICLLAC